MVKYLSVVRRTSHLTCIPYTVFRVRKQSCEDEEEHAGRNYAVPNSIGTETALSSKHTNDGVTKERKQRT
ncbi:hypothetical protein Vi05172_g8602 [Venturia inaequalis]|nr:hypothetical protein Vi05172_g8602 [Venturia inaequalis]